MAYRSLEDVIPGVTAGHGPDLDGRAARVRVQWLPGRQGRPAVLLAALVWVRDCPVAVRLARQMLDELFADYPCTPASWSEAQAVRQVLALFNQRLFQGRSTGETALIDIGVLLVQGDDLLFFQVGAVGLLRCRGGVLQAFPATGESQLGRSPELGVVQHSLQMNASDALLLAPQPLLALSDQASLRMAQLHADQPALQRWFQGLLAAPGAALLLCDDRERQPPLLELPSWPKVVRAHPGQRLDGWTLLGNCDFGPAQRVFLAEDEEGRKALLCLAEQDADEAFWQREWAIRRSPVASLLPLLSPRRPRTRAYWLWALPGPGMLALDRWLAQHQRLSASQLLAVLDQLIEALRALQRRGMQGVWLEPRQILLDATGNLCVLAEGAVQLPGGLSAQAPQGWVPLAPELRRGEVMDSRAEQFLVAACAYWLLAGRWPGCAMPDGGDALDASARYYRPLAAGLATLPVGWDGVLAKALAPRPEARFAALSELRQALEDAMQRGEQASREDSLPLWRGLALVFLGLQLCLGLWYGLGG